jgi:general secretion pathway protein N
MSAASARLLRVALIGFFGWSVLVLLLAEAGMGGRYALHPDDPGRVEPLPQLHLSRAESRLRQFADYAQVGERPLFNADRRPQASDAAPAAVVEAPPPPVELDLVLTSVILAGDKRIAVVAERAGGNAQSLRLGQALGGQQSAWKLVELQPRHAVFEGPAGRSRVDLRVFDGVGGQAPTPVSMPPGGVVQVETTENPEAIEQQSPEQRAESIRKRIEERRRQMREEAARANQERGQ